MSNDFFSFFKKYEQQNLDKVNLDKVKRGVEKFLSSQQQFSDTSYPEQSYPEQLYDELLKVGVNQVNKTEVYDNIGREELDAIKDITGKGIGFVARDELSDISYPRELSNDNEEILVFRTAIVRARKDDIKDAPWEIEETREKFEDGIQRVFGKIVAMDNYNSKREVVILTSKEGADKEKIMESVKNHQWEHGILKMDNDVEMSSFFKSDGTNSVIVVPREDVDQYLVVSFVPKIKHISKPSPFSVFYKKLKPYQVVTKLYKEGKDITVAFHDLESPGFSEYLLDLTFRENGLKLKHYSSIDYSSSQALIEKHEINDEVLLCSRA